MRSDELQPPDATTASDAKMLAPDRLLGSATAFWRSAVLLSANELGLFAELAAGPCDAGTIERRLGLLPEATADFLDALVALGLVERSGDHYRNTLEASLFLDPAKPDYIGQQLAMASAAMRELADPTRHLRAAGANEQERASLSHRMWADIAEILRIGSAHDDA
jgi:DNA-binding IclR family transcriptional regulator